MTPYISLDNQITPYHKFWCSYCRITPTVGCLYEQLEFFCLFSITATFHKPTLYIFIHLQSNLGGICHSLLKNWESEVKYIKVHLKKKILVYPNYERLKHLHNRKTELSESVKQYRQPGEQQGKKHSPICKRMQFSIVIKLYTN